MFRMLCLAGAVVVMSRAAGFARHPEPETPMRRTATTNAHWDSVVVTPSPKQPKIRSRDKFNPAWWLKNADDPVPPDWFKPNAKGRKAKWHARNPLHNFNAYVIGIADKRFVRSGKYPERMSNPDGGWNFAVAKYKWWRLPYVSYDRGKFHFYVGWRVNGAFGAKLNFSAAKKSGEAARAKRATAGAAPTVTE